MWFLWIVFWVLSWLNISFWRWRLSADQSAHFHFKSHQQNGVPCKIQFSTGFLHFLLFCNIFNLKSSNLFAVLLPTNFRLVSIFLQIIFLLDFFHLILKFIYFLQIWSNQILVTKKSYLCVTRRKLNFLFRNFRTFTCFKNF